MALRFFFFSALINDTILPPEKRIIKVRQRPCSVRSERDAGTYVEFCGLPEMLGSSSNNNNNNNDNNNKTTDHIIYPDTALYKIPTLLSLLKMVK